MNHNQNPEQWRSYKNCILLANVTVMSFSWIDFKVMVLCLKGYHHQSDVIFWSCTRKICLCHVTSDNQIKFIPSFNIINCIYIQCLTKEYCKSNDPVHICFTQWLKWECKSLYVDIILMKVRRGSCIKTSIGDACAVVCVQALVRDLSTTLVQHQRVASMFFQHWD